MQVNRNFNSTVRGKLADADLKDLKGYLQAQFNRFLKELDKEGYDEFRINFYANSKDEDEDGDW